MRRIRGLWPAWLASLVLLVCGLAGSATAGTPPATTPVEFTLTVSPTAGTLTDDYIATLQTVIHGVNGAERFWPPDFGDFQVLNQRAQQSTQWSYDPRRGQEIANVEVRRFQLRATRAGRLRIGEARLRLDGIEYKTKPIVVEVAAAGATPQAQPDTEAPESQLAPGYKPPTQEQLAQVFLHAVVDKPKAVQGEQVTVTWLLFTRSEVLKFEPKPPKLDGFWAETLYEPQAYFQYHDAVVQGHQFQVAVVSRRALFPIKPGKLVIPKYEADVSTLYSSFGTAARLASPELTVDVQPLPPGGPAGFDPAWVGNFTASASVDRDQVPAGESLTLALTMQGTGAIRRTRVPALSLEGFQVIAPHDCDEKVEAPGDVLRGERKCLYLLTPTKGGKLGVGPIDLPFFDPRSGKYEAAHVDAIPINVVGDPSAVASKAAGGGAAGENVIDRQIRPPREEPNLSSRIVARFYHSRAFLAALGVPPVLFVLVVLGDKLRERMRRETPRARLRRARGRARKRMRVAELHLRGGRAGKFFGEVQKVLTEHIEERVGEPVSAMTREQLGGFLPSRGFPDETVEALVRELENADFARFAPSASGPGEMRASLRRVRALLTAIERVRPTTKGGSEEAAA